jgi:capsular polysaccharide biosynthesis protein
VGPAAFAEEMRANVRSWEQKYPVSPPVAVAELRNAVVCQHVVYVEQGGETRVIYESFRPNDRPYTRLIPREQTTAGRAYPGVCCYLGAVGTQSYPHWVIDILPRAAIAAARAKSPLRWLIPSYDPDLDRVKAESLAATLGYAPEIELVNEDDVLHVERLLYVSPTSYHPMLKSPPAMLDVRDRIARSVRTSPRRAANRKIFLTRRPARIRNLLNTAAVASLLARYGFEMLDSEDLTFAERADAFCGAAVVVGVMGGGMANTLFCPPGAHVIHLAPEGWLEPLYWDLASILGQTYSCIYGRAASTEPPPHARDFSIDLGDLLRCLGARPVEPSDLVVP